MFLEKAARSDYPVYFIAHYMCPTFFRGKSEYISSFSLFLASNEVTCSLYIRLLVSRSQLSKVRLCWKEYHTRLALLKCQLLFLLFFFKYEYLFRNAPIIMLSIS